MPSAGVGAAVVLDPEQPGPGILTERDILDSLGAGQDPDTERVADHLTAELVFAAPDWSLEEAAAAMVRGGFRHLIVIERRRDRRHPLRARHRPLLDRRRRDLRRPGAPLGGVGRTALTAGETARQCRLRALRGGSSTMSRRVSRIQRTIAHERDQRADDDEPDRTWSRRRAPA